MLDNEIIKLYTIDALGSTTIAKQLKLERNYVYRILKRNGVLRTKHDADALAGSRRIGTKTSTETKQKLSESMKLAHAEHRHPGWSSINVKKERSYPEQILLKLLIKYDICSKYTIIEQFPISRYLLDFALIDYKIDIEIDGQFHIIDTKCIEKDIYRDAFLIKNGWKIFRISWKELKNDASNIMNELINFINDTSLTERRYEISKIILEYKKPISRSRDEYTNDRNIEYETKNKPLIDLVVYSNIDFSKFGWVNKVSELIKIKPQKVNKWMKRFLPELYNSKCFKRSKPL